MRFDPASVFREELCTNCGICSSVCPVSAISVNSLGHVVSFSALCIGCGHCGCYCPVNCFSLNTCDEFDKSSPEGVITSLVKNRRSTRTFSSRELSSEVIRELLEPVGYSPTGHNDQNIQVGVLLGKEKIRARAVIPIVRLVRILDSFRFLTLLAGPGRDYIRRLREGEDLVTWGAPCVLIFKAPLRNATSSADGVIAASLVSLKAEAMGLGTLWNGVLKIAAPFLGLGRATAVLCVGYPQLKKHQMVPERKWKMVDL